MAREFEHRVKQAPTPPTLPPPQRTQYLASSAQFSAGVSGESASIAALDKLRATAAGLKASVIQPLLDRALAAIIRADVQEGAKLALQALELDEKSGVAWYTLALAREQGGDFAGSITCYEAALSLLPDHGEIANNLGRLAFRLGQFDVAEKLFRHFLARYPNNPDGANNLACALRSQRKFDEAVDVLKDALTADPGQAIVWNTLGTVLAEQGDSVNAAVFFEEAIRLNPGLATARYNRGNMRLVLGDAQGALTDCESALAQTRVLDERAMMRLARSTILINVGRVGDGWDEYEARLDPHFSGVTQFLVDRPNWAPGADLHGKFLLLYGEQGLGDEVLFANTLPDILADLGPTGRLALAVEPRLVGLFQRAFPGVQVGGHATYDVEGRTVRTAPFLHKDLAKVDLWAPLASMLRQYRRKVEDFPNRHSFLAADPQRVAHWQERLANAPAGRKVGLLWKSAVTDSGRHRFFSAFEDWEPVLKTPGITFVNLQYGDCAAELEHARSRLGIDIWSPPGIDLKQDLDDVAALSCALDLVIGFSNATFNIAAACGVPAWLISAPGAWPRLGTTRYPWYPQTQVFLPPGFAQWGAVMEDVAQSLAEFAKIRV